MLALQGDFEAHARALERAGASAVLVKHPEQIAGLSGLILPGGESTTMLKFFSAGGFPAAVREAAAAGTPLFGTCAGAILVARSVENPPQDSLNLIDITVRRNAYGRQLSSFIAREDLPALAGEPLEMVFIRAPIIESAGPGVEILGSCRGKPVLVRQDQVLVSTFHPELTSDFRVHRLFLQMAERGGSR